METRHKLVALTSNGDESAVADVDDVVTTDGLRVFGVGVGDQRTNATPGARTSPRRTEKPKTPEMLTISDSWSVCGVYLIDRTTIGYAIVLCSVLFTARSITVHT